MKRQHGDYVRVTATFEGRTGSAVMPRSMATVFGPAAEAAGWTVDAVQGARDSTEPAVQDARSVRSDLHDEMRRGGR